MICKKCGAQSIGDAQFCRKCGAELVADTVFCTKCGTQIAEGAEFCHKCGTKTVVDFAASQASIEPTALTVSEPVAQEKQIVSEAPVEQQKTSAQPQQQYQQPMQQYPPGASDPPAPYSAAISSNNAFQEYVDNHVRATTKFQTAKELIENSKPWLFAWIIMGASLLGIIGGPVIVITLIFGYAVMFIASGIIRMRYRSRFYGEFIGEIDFQNFIDFLNEHLKYIHPYFHEWGFLSKKGLLPILENAVVRAMEEVRICSEYGPKRKKLVCFYIRPKNVEANPGEYIYNVDATQNGFMIDVRAAGFLGHGALIRTAPILQAAMKYYLESRNS